MRKYLTIYNFIIHMRMALVIYDYVTEENFLFFFISASADERTGPQNDNLRFFFILFCLTCTELTCPNSDGGVHARREHCIWQNMLCDGHQENRFLNLYLGDCRFLGTATKRSITQR